MPMVAKESRWSTQRTLVFVGKTGLRIGQGTADQHTQSGHKVSARLRECECSLSDCDTCFGNECRWG